MRISFVFLFFYSFFISSILGQTSFWVKDSLDKKPIYGAKLLEKIVVIATSGQDGKISFLGSESNTYSLQSLSYKSVSFNLQQIKDTFFLSPARISLAETSISPTNAKQILEEAFQHVLENHAPISFYQNGTYREEFIESGKTFKAQELLFQLHQFQKNKMLETRPFYLLNSNTKLLASQVYEDSNAKEKIKSIIGKRVADRMNFNELSLYTFIKGTNILNRIFTYLLAPDSKYQVKYQYISTEIYQSQEVLKIEVQHLLKSTLVTTSTVYIASESKAIVGFEIMAHQNIENISVFNFKTKFILWILGIKIQIKQYYAKVLFEKNNKGFWTVSDVLFEFPAIFQKKQTLHGLAKVKYRLAPQVWESKDFGSDFSAQNTAILLQKNILNPPFQKPNFPSIPVTEPEKTRWRHIR